MRTGSRAMSEAKLRGCDYCAGEPEPGWIEMRNNGPIVPCPICNNEDDYDRAERQRRHGASNE